MWTHPEKTCGKMSPCTPTQTNEGADTRPQHTPGELILTGTTLTPGPGRAPRMGDGEQGGGWLEMALEPGMLGEHGLRCSQQGSVWTSFSTITPFAAPCPPTCSFQGKACLVRLSLGCIVARLDRWPLENQPSKSCPSFCQGRRREI